MRRAAWRRFGQGSGKQNIGTGQCGVRHAVEDQPYIIIPDPDIGQPTLLDMAEKAGNAVDERLGPDKAGLWPGRSDGRQILSATKADLPETGLPACPPWCRQTAISGLCQDLTGALEVSSPASRAWCGAGGRPLRRP